MLKYFVKYLECPWRAIKIFKKVTRNSRSLHCKVTTRINEKQFYSKFKIHILYISIIHNSREHNMTVSTHSYCRTSANRTYHQKTLFISHEPSYHPLKYFNVHRGYPAPARTGAKIIISSRWKFLQTDIFALDNETRLSNLRNAGSRSSLLI